MRFTLKQIAILTLIIIVIIASVPSVAHAQVGVIAAAISAISSLVSSLAKTALGVAKEYGILMGKVGIFLGVSWLALAFANGCINWALSPLRADIGFTHNAFVLTGWGVLRDITNMLFILVLIAIGIATALRIREYQIKKTLPRLIAVVLLINFTPVICGVIIDASNILMNFFFAAGTAGFSQPLNLSGNATTGLTTLLGEAIRHPAELLSGRLMFQAIVLMAFNFVAAFILIILAGLFIIRYVALWTLVILSPLAFFCYILPATKRFWVTWWHQFIQWCFLGIGAAFFLYLAQVLSQEVNNLIVEPSAEALALRSTLTFILIQSIPLVFLIIGYFILSSTSAAGASLVFGLAQKGLGTVKSKAMPAMWKELQRRRARAIPKEVKEKMARLETARPFGAKVPGFKGTLIRGVTAPATWLLRGTGKLGRWIVTGGIAEEVNLMNRGYREAKEAPDIYTLLNRFRSPIPLAEKVGILKAAEEKEWLKLALDESKVGRAALTPQEIINVYRKAREMGNKDVYEALEMRLFHNTELREAFGRISMQVANESAAEFAKRIRESLGKTKNLEKIDYDKIRMNPEAHAAFMQAALRFSPHQLSEAGRKLGSEFIDEVQRRAEELGPEWFFEIDPETGHARNPQLVRYLASTGAQNIGFAPLHEARTREEIEGFATESRRWETALSRANTEEEINALMEEIRRAEEESANERLRKIITSARVAAQTKLQRLRESTEEEETSEEGGTEAGEEETSGEEAGEEAGEE